MARYRPRYGDMVMPASDDRRDGGYDDDYTGNALTDGYTCLGVRPRTAAPGSGFLTKEEAADYDDLGYTMRRYGGDEFQKRRQGRDLDDDPNA